MSRLKAVVPKNAIPSKPKILIYGRAGVGKTWSALDFPSVYYIDTEGGADLAHYTDKLVDSGGMYLGPDLGSNSFETVIDQVKALATEQHSYRTLVIDSISILFNTAVAEAAEELGDRDQYGASKKAGVSKMRILLRWLRKLDMNVILIAHAMPEYGIGKGGQNEKIGETFDAWDRLDYELHLCLQIEKQGKSRFARVRKSRLKEFQDTERFPWSYSDFADRYGRDVIEATSEAIALATAEQVAEVTKLLAVVKVPEGWEAKFLSDSDAAGWAEVSAERAAGVITRLRANVSQFQEVA